MVRGVLSGIVFTGLWAAQLSCDLLLPRAVAQAGTAPAAAPVAGAPGAEAPSLFGALIEMLPMLAVCYLIFYFMVIRPQETKTKQHKALLESMKRGDSVVTSSGIVGKVSGIEGDHILLEVAPNVKVKFLRQHIVRLENPPQTSKAA
jgi:preprotein translocase subunit YajC